MKNKVIYPIVAFLSVGLLTEGQGRIELKESDLQSPIGMFESRSALEPLNDTSTMKSMFDYEYSTDMVNLNQTSTDEACNSEEDFDNFNEKLADAVDPSRNCRKIINLDPNDRKKYCECLSKVTFNKVNPTDMNYITDKLKDEAKTFSDEIIRANVSAIQDKLLAGISLHNQIKNRYPSYKNSCDPSMMIKSVSEAGMKGACANGKMKRLDKVLAKENAFDEIISLATKLNHDTSNSKLDNKNINQGIDEIVKLLQKINQAENAKGNESVGKIEELKAKLETELKDNPIFKIYKVDFFNPITGATETINNLHSARLGLAPQEDLMGIIREKLKDQSFSNSDEIRKEISGLFKHNIENLKNLCDELKGNIDFMCEKALDNDYSLSLIQNNPVHLAQVVKSVFVQFNPSEFKFNMEANDLAFNKNLMSLPKSYDNKLLGDKVDLLQCTFAFKELTSSFVLGASEKQLDPSLYALGKFTHPLQMTIGDSSRFKDLIGETNRFDPYKKLEKASDEQLLKTAIITQGSGNIDNYRLTDNRRKRTSASEMLDRTFGDKSEYGRQRSSLASNKTEALIAAGSSAAASTPTNSDNYSSGVTSPTSNMSNMPTLPQSSNNHYSSNNSDDLDAKEAGTSSQSVIDSYEKRLSTMMEKLEALTTQRKEKAVAEEKKGAKVTTEVAPTVEETELKSTISKLKDQIATLQSKQKAIDSAKASKPTSAVNATTVKNFTPATAKKMNHTSKTQTTESAPIQNYVTKTPSKPNLYLSSSVLIL